MTANPDLEKIQETAEEEICSARTTSDCLDVLRRTFSKIQSLFSEKDEELNKIRHQKVEEFIVNPTLIEGAFFVNQLMDKHNKYKIKIAEQQREIEIVRSEVYIAMNEALKEKDKKIKELNKDKDTLTLMASNLNEELNKLRKR